MRSFILIAYKFPPYDQVGSLRWTKLTKYLARLGHTIHVVTVDWEGIGKMSLEELRHPNIHIHIIPSNYPHKLKYKAFKNKYLNFLKSIPFRFFLDKFICFDDEAQLWKKPLLKKLTELVESKKIETIIATGGPFQSMRWASEFKKNNYHNIKLILDFRDPWASEPFKRVTPKQRQLITKWQRESIETADKIVAVTEHLRKECLEDIFKDAKGITITNGFDHESAPSLHEAEHFAPLELKKISLVHAGNIANGRETPLLELLQILEENPKLCSRFSVYLIGDLGVRTTMKLSHQFPNLMNSKSLIFIKRIPQSEVFKYLMRATFALHLNGPELPGANSTKIFEYGMMKKPTLSLNYGGEVDQLIQQNDLGYSVNLEKIKLESVLETISVSPEKNFQIKIEDFSHPNLAKKYSNLINSL